MSRIRSVHPGLWTDERFASVEPLARLLFIGIWNECDDQGIFEWSALKLKMRILPADNSDASTLLAALAAAGMVLPFEVGGRALGAVRNFARYQRPKKPNAVYPASELALSFAKDGSAPVRHPFPTAPEIQPQREEEGGRRKDSEAEASGAEAPAPDDISCNPPKPIDLKASVFASGIPLLTAAGQPNRSARSMLGRWRQTFGDGAVIDALAACQAEAASDPIPYITRTLEARNGKRTGQGGRNGTRPEHPIFAARRDLGIDPCGMEPVEGFSRDHAGRLC